MSKTPSSNSVLTKMRVGDKASIAFKNYMKPSKLTKEWSKFIPDEGYEKHMQDVKLKNGIYLYGCWPNAGVWNICYPQPDPENKKYDEISVEETDEVRLTHNPNW